MRERYGSHLFGSSALLGRRLIEAGVRFVDVYWDGYQSRMPTGLDPYWDTHSNNFVQLRDVNLPYLDLTYSALLEDMDQRGLLDETLVVMMSDFGRTPRVNSAAGRDHWTKAYSMVFAGAGVRGGQVVGRTDRDGGYVTEGAVIPEDYAATVYEKLGIDRAQPLYTPGGRPTYPGHAGEPIPDLF